MTKKKEATPASPLVAAAEAPSVIRFPPLLYSIIFFLTQEDTLQRATKPYSKKSINCLKLGSSGQ
jgi:hypothetical protein